MRLLRKPEFKVYCDKIISHKDLKTLDGNKKPEMSIGFLANCIANINAYWVYAKRHLNGQDVRGDIPESVLACAMDSVFGAELSQLVHCLEQHYTPDIP